MEAQTLATEAGGVRRVFELGGFLDEFCSNCGGALWSRSPNDPEVVAVRLGTFEGDPGIRPQPRQFVAYAAPWEPIPDDGLPRFPERPT